MLNLGNNAFLWHFLPLHHSFGFPNMILEGESLDSLDPSGSTPTLKVLMKRSISNKINTLYCPIILYIQYSPVVVYNIYNLEVQLLSLAG